MKISRTASPQQKREYMQWYRSTEAGKAARRRYELSDKGKALAKRSRNKVKLDPVKLEKYRDYQRKFQKSPRGKDLDRKKRGLPLPTRPEPLVCERPGCGRSRESEGKALALDHCHITGVFRGWLCGSCNQAIGSLGDNIEGVENALTYLKRAYSRPSSLEAVNA